MVEWKRMWEVTTWDKKFSGVDKLMQPTVLKYHYYLANELAELERPNGDIRILYTTDKEAFVDSDDVEGNISEGEVVTIPWGGNVNIQYYKGRFVTADNRIATSNNVDYLCNKYLYYWMLSQKEEIGMFYRGAGIKHPSMLSVLTMLVPIPSISEQQRIVDILDTFTSSIENLKDQIALRRKQYEYYRDQLLDIEGKDGVEWKSIDEIKRSLKTGLNPRQNFKLNTSTAEFPYITGKDIYNNQINISDNTDKIDAAAISIINKRACLEKGLLLFASTGCGTVGRMAIIKDYNHDWAISETLYAIKFISDILPDYVMQCLYANYIKKQYEPKISRGSVPHLKVADLLKVNIPIPSIIEQQRIVSILDTFEASIANLEAQLAQREKQYEYYRNKLLTFE